MSTVLCVKAKLMTLLFYAQSTEATTATSFVNLITKRGSLYLYSIRIDTYYNRLARRCRRDFYNFETRK